MSPLQIPGAILKELPDKRSTGVCRKCRRSYRKLKILRKGGLASLHCPHCGTVVKEGKKK